MLLVGKVRAFSSTLLLANHVCCDVPEHTILYSTTLHLRTVSRCVIQAFPLRTAHIFLQSYFSLPVYPHRRFTLVTFPALLP